MAPCSLSIYFATTSAVLFMLSTVPFTDGFNDTVYEACSSLYSCGLVKDVGYPFCGDHRPTYCGLHEFRLKCTGDSNYPSISLSSSGQYNVHRIKTSSYTMVVARDKNETCRVLDKDQKSIDLLARFKLKETVGNITLFYGCPGNTSTVFKLNSRSFQCSFLYQNVSVYYFNETSDGNQCRANVTLPVSKKLLGELKHENGKLDNVLLEEFEIGYTADFNECSSCRKSGGLCGSSLSNATVFACHKPEKRSMRDVGLMLGLGITGAIMLAAAVAWYCKRLKTGHSRLVLRSNLLEPTSADLEKDSIFFGIPLFSHRELEEATDNFNGSRELGNGGFGIVFYGKLKDGREVAVKRLYEKSYRRVELFMNEVKILASLQHQNLVSLYGCTSPNYDELLLVYAYVPNGTVADHLHGGKAKSGSLSWPIRLRIAIETASALAYLHASEIIHRDVKTKNILLDGNFGVKVADFGLSRLFPSDVTHVSTAPQGTPGYLDPEYHQYYQLTVKSDVYSFGVVLIELISSLPAVDMNRQKEEINLSNYAVKRIQQGLFHELVDPKLGFESDSRVKRMITSVAELAFQCLQHDKEFRPSMNEVLQVLKRFQNADYEALEAKGELKSDGRGGNARTPASPSEADDAGLLFSSSHFQQHPLSPNSVMDRWRSSSTAKSSTSR